MSGIQPVENFVIETIYDVSDPRLTEFRDSIYEEDLELDKRCRTLSFDKIKLYVDENKFEDAWKYSDEKWYRVGFDAIEAIIEDGKIVGMSGCRIYGNFLRSSMHLYLLKRVRKKYPGIKYLKNGWFERHIDFANKFNMKGIFFTVYAYSRKLQALINNHRGKTISLIDKKHLNYIQDVREIGEFQFNNVPQTFFYYKLTEEFDISNVMSNNNKIVRIGSVQIPIHTGDNIGISLSGGLDSALLLYVLMSNMNKNQTLHIYSMAKKEAFYDSAIFSPKIIRFCLEKTKFINIRQHILYIPYSISDTGQSGHDIIYQNPLKDFYDHSIDIFYSGVTANPPEEDMANFNPSTLVDVETVRNILDRENIYRYDRDGRMHSITPFINSNKREIFKAYEKLGILDLVKLTRSCIGNKVDGHCNRCWWCEERKWGGFSL